MKQAHSIRIWTAPLILAGASAIGLVSALLADGLGDVLAWLTLAAPVVVVCWCLFPRVQNTSIRARRGQLSRSERAR